MSGSMTKQPKANKQSGKKTGLNPSERRYSAQKFRQGDHSLYVFCAKASELWEFLSINRRDTDKNEGYQRVLPNSRVQSVASYVREGHLIPNSILVSFDNAEYDAQSGEIVIPPGSDVGWVIDGQHRLAGAYEAAKDRSDDYEFCVVAAIGLEQRRQIELFITINREAKGVPSSLVLDLLGHIPKKRASDIANERAADIARALRDNDDSPLHNRIVLDGPRSRQVSMVNFVRKVTPYVHIERGMLRDFSLEEQYTIFSNYFIAIKDTYSEEWSRENSIFFKTVGFGAMLNVFEKYSMSALKGMPLFRYQI